MNNGKKTAFLLEGGGMRGLYTAGVLDVFLDENIETDCILGVSAGALFSTNYKSRQRGRTLRYNLKYVNDKNYMSLYSLITTGDLVNREFCYITIPTQLDIFDNETYMSTPEDFYCVVTNIETGKPEYIKLTDLAEQMDTLRASGSLPFVSRPVEVDGKKYLDGGIADSIPIEKILEMEYEKIVVVLTRHGNYRKEEKGMAPAKIFYHKYPKLIEALNKRNSEYNRQIEIVDKLEKEGRIFVIRPSEELKLSRIEKDTEKLQAVYDVGIKDAKACIERLKEYLK